jgi:hypothetical protein
VAAADSVAAVSEVTVWSVAPAGIPVPVMVRPASSSLKVPAAAVMLALALVVVTVTVRASVVRPATIEVSFQDGSAAK